MVIPKINSAHGSDTRNILNRAIDLINVQGKSIQDLVAKGQLTPTQYATLIQAVNGLIAKGEVSVNDIDPNLGKIGLSLLSDEVTRAISGNASVNPIIGDSTVTTQKIALSAVDFDNINFVKKSSNLFNRGDVTTGKSINPTTGSPSDNASFNLSGYIRVSPSSTYNMIDVGRWGLYKSDFSFISSNTQQSITTTSETFYMRVAVASVRLGTAQLNRGSIKSYEPYYVEFDNSNKTGLIIEPSKNTVDNEAIKEGAVDLTQTTFFRKPNNLFNKFDVIQNRRIDGFGNLVTDDLFVTSNNFQKIEPSTKYSFSNTFVIAIYDANENHIVTQTITQGTGEYTTPANAALVKFSVSKSIYENAMFNKGSLLPFEEHKYKLFSTPQFPLEIPSGSGGGGGSDTSLTYSDKIVSEYYETYSGSLSSGSTQLVATINGSLLSKEIYMSTNDLNTELSIEIRMDGGTYKPYKLLASDGSGEVPITMENLIAHGSTEFLISAWDIATKQYAFNLREKQFGNGIKVSVKNNGSTSVNASVRVSGGKYA